MEADMSPEPILSTIEGPYHVVLEDWVVHKFGVREVLTRIAAICREQAAVERAAAGGTDSVASQLWAAQAGELERLLRWDRPGANVEPTNLGRLKTVAARKRYTPADLRALLRHLSPQVSPETGEDQVLWSLASHLGQDRATVLLGHAPAIIAHYEASEADGVDLEAAIQDFMEGRV